MTKKKDWNIFEIYFTKKKKAIYSNIFMIYFFGIFHKNHIYFKYISKYIPNVNWIYLYIDIFIYWEYIYNLFLIYVNILKIYLQWNIITIYFKYFFNISCEIFQIYCNISWYIDIFRIYCDIFTIYWYIWNIFHNKLSMILGNPS